MWFVVWWLRLEYICGCCFSWKAWQIFATAWQIFATAWQKIGMPCAGLRQGGCLGVGWEIFSFILCDFFRQIFVGSKEVPTFAVVMYKFFLRV